MPIRDFLEKTEQYAIEIINGRQRSTSDRLFRVLLFLLSRAYRNVVQLRLTLYDNFIIRRQALGCFVISVGNLTVGGTGKTPVVELLAKTLAARGRHVAILSRGYRSKPRPWFDRLRAAFAKDYNAIPPKIVSDGKQVFLDSGEAGDEPFMLARNLLAQNDRTGVAVVVDKNRVKGGKYAISHLQADTLLLDDGFQYIKLQPWLNILLVDSTNPFHNHEPLPLGLLREPIKNLRRADFIFLTKSNGGNHLRHLRSFLKRHNPRAEIIECNHEPRHFQDVRSSEQVNLDYIRGKRVAALCAIAVPESFENYLTDLGATIVYRKRFVDHHRYRAHELRDFINAANKHHAEILVTTEKDAVRLPELPAELPPFYFLRVEINILDGIEHFHRCITRICLS
ncbi:MAG: tetraacyldisaccharide 4'-kinase [Lentisphaerae bacterium]|nr:tetraacyldisaccharide 4'-kinase [Lentisphaerota bacterium]OQC11821.1 MAG: Tetraacyldisaccharide 4'-kinase [Lentisphaerae bacterium ADurb.Bin082]HQL86755.1 tetraacyldisaccharide 4'-kinase [Lentisphaeria bacterium]